MKKINIIGANSYIARNLIYVLKRDYQCQLRLYDYAPEQKDGETGYVSVNVFDKESVSKIDFDCDVVFMFVGKTGSAEGFDDFNTFIDVNMRSLLTILNEMRKKKSKAKIIFPSTRLVYKGVNKPQKEDAEKEFKTIYAINKFACEVILEQYRNVFGIDYCIFRICIPYGTLIEKASSYGTAEFMLSKAIRGENISLYGDGSQRRTLTYIEDLCTALIRGAFCDKCVNDVFNSGGEDYSLLEMAELIASVYDVKIDHVKWPETAFRIESGSTVFDSSKFDALRLTNYKTKFSDWCRHQKKGGGEDEYTYSV